MPEHRNTVHLLVKKEIKKYIQVDNVYLENQFSNFQLLQTLTTLLRLYRKLRG